MKRSKYFPALLAAVLSMSSAVQANVIVDQSQFKILAPVTPGIDLVMFPDGQRRVGL